MALPYTLHNHDLNTAGYKTFQSASQRDLEQGARAWYKTFHSTLQHSVSYWEQDTREPSVNQCISSPYLAHLLPTILHESAHYHHDGDDDVGLDCVGVDDVNGVGFDDVGVGVDVDPIGVDVDDCQSLANSRFCPGNVF